MKDLLIRLWFVPLTLLWCVIGEIAFNTPEWVRILIDVSIISLIILLVPGTYYQIGSVLFYKWLLVWGRKELYTK